MYKVKLNKSEVLEIAEDIYFGGLNGGYGPAVKTRDDRVRVLADFISRARLMSMYEFSDEDALEAAELTVERVWL